MTGCGRVKSVPTGRRALLSHAHTMSSEGLNLRDPSGKALGMSEESRKNMSREERLAAKLRENLRRRKTQARAQAGGETGESRDNGLFKPDAQS
ncbi:hypothetical protein Ga0102493_111055 [Erythrobacter litoralis]|nr:hypothetical protein Ga0102493_111055 [Erythrobacter litoralis]